MQWNGMEWNGMEWNGMELNRVGVQGYNSSGSCAGIGEVAGLQAFIDFLIHRMDASAGRSVCIGPVKTIVSDLWQLTMPFISTRLKA
eukprot:scaffold214298_cov16-Prasinocladus_malaysianus.AAC.1